jgi:tRNA threonylcarbamoyladenosine dehydratase
MQIDPFLSPDEQGRRFGGISRCFDAGVLQRFASAHVVVVGVGGVGSWAVEALVRSGIGRLTLIDMDHVAISNINRQLPALESTLGRAKIEVLAERMRDINPAVDVQMVDDFVSAENLSQLLPAGADFVIDAIDQWRTKMAMILFCRRQRLPLVVTGSAGGKLDPGRIQLADLSQTIQDPLCAKIRASLRKEHGFARGDKKRFGVPVVFSSEPVKYPGSSCAPSAGGAPLGCAGFGSFMPVTASFGLMAASHVLHTLAKDVA